MKQVNRETLIKAVGIIEGVYYCSGNEKVNHGLVTVIEMIEEILDDEEKLEGEHSNDRRAD